MGIQDFATTTRRRRVEQEQPSALAYWGTGLSCLSFLLLVFWLAGMKF